MLLGWSSPVPVLSIYPSASLLFHFFPVSLLPFVLLEYFFSTQMLEGQDWLFAGSTLQVHQPDVWLHLCVGTVNPRRASNLQQAGRRGWFMHTTEETLFKFYFCLWQAFLELIFVSVSHTSSFVLSEFWRIFSWVWWAGKATIRRKSGVVCWQRGRQ